MSCMRVARELVAGYIILVASESHASWCVTCMRVSGVVRIYVQQVSCAHVSYT